MATAHRGEMSIAHTLVYLIVLLSFTTERPNVIAPFVLDGVVIIGQARGCVAMAFVLN